MSVYKWAPQTPIALVHCMGDDVVPFDISVNTKASLDGYGAASVELVPVEVSSYTGSSNSTEIWSLRMWSGSIWRNGTYIC